MILDKNGNKKGIHTWNKKEIFERGLGEFHTYISYIQDILMVREMRKAANNIVNVFVEVFGRTGFKRDRKQINVLRATKDSKLWRALISTSPMDTHMGE